MLSEIFNKFLQYVGQPFSSWSEFWFAITGGFRTFTALDSKTGLLYLFTGLIAAGFAYFQLRKQLPELQNTSFWKFVFPRDVYLHPSAVVDYKYVGFDLTTRFLIYVPFIAGVSQLVYRVLEPLSINLRIDYIANSNYYTRIIFVTVVSALMVDFAVFFSHYLMHKVPFLWPFHEIHHSAEVLTPVTVHRVHPVEELLNGLVTAVVTALMAKTYEAVSGQDISPVTLFGLNIISFVYYIAVYQLRHSHIWLSYGPFWEHFIVSPAQHQIHHSVDTKHWNKNYGFTFAFWDWLFGCLYVPKGYEKIEFGVPNVDQRDFSSVFKLYYLPFVKSARILKRGLTASVGKIRSFQFRTSKSV
jgi:sterol desaturase/sphingolipid hydroxylase (fatty acid hydroxylase superfamily)